MRATIGERANLEAELCKIGMNEKLTPQAAAHTAEMLRAEKQV